MPLERWQQVNEIYVGALVKEPDQRQAYLLQACGTDTDLRRAVESRLALFSAEADPPLVRGVGGRTISHYEVGERVGAGGMGTVYRARDLRLGRMVALKFLKGELVASVDARQRFIREGHALSSLSHPNIATLYEVDEIEGLPFLVLEYLPGGTLRERIRAGISKGNPPSLSQVAGWGMAIAKASAATSLVITLPDPTNAPAPIFTGATSEVFEPTKAPGPMSVKCLKKPS